MSKDTLIENTPNDWQKDRCGHNFLPKDCPWETCAYRDMIQRSEISVKDERWADEADDFSYKIAEAHPLKTGNHETYALASKLVSNRHSKGALVELVNYLLAEGIDKPLKRESGEVELKIRQCNPVDWKCPKCGYNVAWAPSDTQCPACAVSKIEVQESK